MPFEYAADEICPICRCAFGYDYNTIVTATCQAQHAYHQTCFDQIRTQRSCPLCNQVLQPHLAYGIRSGSQSILAGALVKVKLMPSYTVALQRLRNVNFNIETIFAALLRNEFYAWPSFYTALQLDTNHLQTVDDIRKVMQQMFHYSLVMSYQLTLYDNGHYREQVTKIITKLFQRHGLQSGELLHQWQVQFLPMLSDLHQGRGITLIKLVEAVEKQDTAGIQDWLQTLLRCKELRPYAHLLQPLTAGHTAIDIGDATVTYESDSTAFIETFRRIIRQVTIPNSTATRKGKIFACLSAAITLVAMMLFAKYMLGIDWDSPLAPFGATRSAWRSGGFYSRPDNSIAMLVFGSLMILSADLGSMLCWLCGFMFYSIAIFSGFESMFGPPPVFPDLFQRAQTHRGNINPREI